MNVPGVVRNYPFTTSFAPWAFSQYGSSPNIGTAGGTEKLSAQSALVLNATEGNPAPGALQITAPFSMGSEQLDLNQGVTPDEDWTGFEIRTKVKVLQKGNTPDT